MGGWHLERMKHKGFGRTIIEDFYNIDTQEQSTYMALMVFRDVTISEES